EFD
ncbi:merR regulatory family protein, partial [Vibrio parahaemolyticus EKP-026]